MEEDGEKEGLLKNEQNIFDRDLAELFTVEAKTKTLQNDKFFTKNR